MSEFIDDLPDIDGARSPRFCRELIGQEAAVTHFLSNLAQGKLHHACLLTGPKGVGKASFAHMAARFMLHHADPVSAAKNADNLIITADDTLGKQIEQGSHPDLMIVSRPWDVAKERFKQSISIDEVRKIRSFFNLSAGMGGWRVCIIDAADDMTLNAANALLKTLEEPPANSLFLIVSHQSGGLLDTIRSRCMKIAFQPLSAINIQHLMHLGFKGGLKDGSKDGADNADAEQSVAAIAHLSRGSIGRALHIQDTNGLEVYSDMVKLLRQYPQIQTVALHEVAERMSKRNAEHLFVDMGEFLLQWLHQLARSSARGETPRVIFEGEEAAFQAMVADRPLEAWVDVWEKVTELFDNAKRLNLDRKQTVLESFKLIQSGV